MKVHIVPILKDNYAYVVQSDTEVAVIDAGEAKPIVNFLTKNQLRPEWIISTHKHGDHTDGNIELMEAYNCRLAAPAECGESDFILKDGDIFPVGNLQFNIIETKGHTAGHIMLFEPNHKILFSGDTLFAMGCGRLFEGEAGDMFKAMEKIKTLPKDTKIYTGHEYTADNARFATAFMRDNGAIAERSKYISGQSCTMPTVLEDELKTNPFLLAETKEQFADYRKAKDNF